MSAIAVMGESDFYDNILRTPIIFLTDMIIFRSIIFAALFAMNDENAVGKWLIEHCLNIRSFLFIKIMAMYVLNLVSDEEELQSQCWRFRRRRRTLQH